ncbi:MAG TPA: hypothetical protein ENG70_02060 [Candidatus Cloacimonetes bacterium]|nr:hypothetical protein [Candidatus Cloacimonadota bacterium]HEX37633.1 hypothetical protein [Candidatus Cloacimonadota bacterium]
MLILSAEWIFLHYSRLKKMVAFLPRMVLKNAIEIFKDHHINFVRLRIWHNPDDDYCNLP